MEILIGIAIGLVVAGVLYWLQQKKLSQKNEKIKQLRQQQEKLEQTYEARNQELVTSLQQEYQQQSNQKAQTLEHQYQGRMQELEQTHQSQMRELETKHKSRLQELNQSYQAQLQEAQGSYQHQELEQAYQAQMRELEAACELRVQELHRSYQAQLQDINTYTARIQELEQAQVQSQAQLQDINTYTARIQELEQAQVQSQEEISALKQHYEVQINQLNQQLLTQEQSIEGDVTEVQTDNEQWIEPATTSISEDQPLNSQDTELAQLEDDITIDVSQFELDEENDSAQNELFFDGQEAEIVQSRDEEAASEFEQNFESDEAALDDQIQQLTSLLDEDFDFQEQDEEVLDEHMEELADAFNEDEPANDATVNVDLESDEAALDDQIQQLTSLLDEDFDFQSTATTSTEMSEDDLEQDWLDSTDSAVTPTQNQETAQRNPN